VISKLNTLLQLLFILLVISRSQWVAVPLWSVFWLGAIVFCTTVVSGIDYVLTYARAAWAAKRTAR
jgi:phosphatidylglycerophosphate synthase